jgi:hypothetical protein
VLVCGFAFVDSVRSFDAVVLSADGHNRVRWGPNRGNGSNELSQYLDSCRRSKFFFPACAVEERRWQADG